MNMKAIQTVFFIFLFGLLHAQTADEKEIQSTIENMFQDVFSNLDDSKINQYFTPEITIFEQGEIYNQDSIYVIVKNIRDAFQSEENKDRTFKRTNTFDFQTTKINGDTAWISYHNNAVITMDGLQIANLNWLESANLIRTKNGWKIVFLHSTEIKKKEK